MNQIRSILAAGAAMTALALAVPAAAHPDHQTKQEVQTIKIISSDGKETSKSDFAADCGKGRKFESSASNGDDKNKSVNKMVICSDPGESDAAWHKTLSDALARLEKDDHMPAAGKAQIMADLKSEIARIGK